MNLTTKKNAVSILASNTDSEKSLNPLPVSSRISCLEKGDSARKHLETFIQSVFKKYYNADIDHFYPRLLAIESLVIDTSADSNEERLIKAVAGVRCAAEEYLFSEYYLEKSLESELHAIFGKVISREVVVEVGNLAPASVGQMPWLITAMTGFLYSAGFRYIMFTAIPSIFNAFKRVHIPLTIVTQAKQQCLPETIQNKWGPEYYKLNPMVLVADIEQGYDIVKNIIELKSPPYSSLFEQACMLGEQFFAEQKRFKGDAA